MKTTYLLLLTINLFANLGCMDNHQATKANTILTLIQDKDEEQVLSLLSTEPNLLSLRTNNQSSILHLAAAFLTRNFFVQLKELYAQQLDFTATDKNGNIPLHLSARSLSSYPETVLFLLENSNPTARNLEGQTPLHLATKAASTEKVRIICSFFGYDQQKMQQPDDHGRTPIHYCAFGPRLDYSDIVSILEKNHSEQPCRPIACKDSMGQTVVHLAAVQHRKKLLELTTTQNSPLLEQKDAEGKTPLACFLSSKPEKYDNTVFLALLDRGAYTYQTDTNENTMFHHAALAGRIQQFELLTTRKVNPNKKNKLGQTALMYYVAHAKDIDTKIIAELRRYGAEITTTDNNGNTLCHIGAEKRDLPLINFCACQHMDFNIKNNEGKTPLAVLLASPEQEKDDELYSALIYSNAEIDAVDNKGNTLLHHAAAHAKNIIVEKLLKAGLKATTTNNAGETALALCTNSETKSILDPQLDDWQILSTPET